MTSIELRYLSGLDIKALELTDSEILAAIEDSLRAQGNNETVIEPRMHLIPDASFDGHFNVLRGYIGPSNVAGVKIVGDYHNNYQQGLPSEFGLLNLFNGKTGQPKAILDATAITEMRTGAITAIGAKYLAPSKPKILGHIGARGTAYWNVKLLDHLFDFDEIRIHSRRPESRDAFAKQLENDLGKPIRVTDNWQDCLDGADILVEASRLTEPAPLFKSSWIKSGALVVPYGTMSTVEDDIIEHMDDPGQCTTRVSSERCSWPGPTGPTWLWWRCGQTTGWPGALPRTSMACTSGPACRKRPSPNCTAICSGSTAPCVRPPGKPKRSSRS